MADKKEKTADIIDLDTVRKAKMTGSELDNELNERIERIKASITRINKLMAELRSGAERGESETNELRGFQEDNQPDNNKE